MAEASDQRTRGTTALTSLAVGFTTAGAQVMLLRELLVVAGGNELAAGVALTCWMMAAAGGSAIGGSLAGRFALQVGPTRRLTSIAAAAAGGCVPLAIVLVDLGREWLGPPAGELAAPHQVLAISVVALLPVCLALGLTYPLLCRQAQADGVPASRAAAGIFWLEALGFGGGGLLAGLVLLPLVPAPVMAAALMLVLLGAAVYQWPQGGRRAFGSALALVAAAGIVEMASRTGRLGEAVVASRDTVHSRIQIAAREGQHDVYVDGLWAFAYPDPESVEWAVHPAMLLVERPADVLLVGGAVSGSLGAVLQHDAVQHVDVVEPDPGLIGLAREHLPTDAVAPLDDPRVRLHLTDGRAFVRAAEGPYDLVLLSLPDPHNAQLNRFYTVEFFQLVRGLLGHGGVLALGVSGASDMLGPNQARYVASVRAVADEVFEQVVALPGARTIVAGTPRAGGLPADSEAMADALQQRGVQTEYVTPFTLAFELGPMRADYLRQVLDGADTGELNRDLQPLCFHHNNVLWATAQAPWMQGLFLRLESLRPGWLLGAALLGALLHALATWLRPTSAVAGRAAIPAAVAVVGATGIVAEVVVILGYQVAFGHLFARIGMIVAAYMLGLAVGARAVEAAWLRPTYRTLVTTQAALAVGSAALAVLVSGPEGLPAVGEPLFAAVAAAAGLAAGIHFPTAVRLTGERGSAGRLYAWDLAGAAVGSLVASIALLPLLGVPAVLVLLSALNLGALVVLWACRVRGILPASWAATSRR